MYALQHTNTHTSTRMSKAYTSCELGTYFRPTFFAHKFHTYFVLSKVLGKVWPGFKNKYDLDIYDLR